MRRQLDFVERMQVIIFLRNIPGHVRFVKTEREEERLVVFLAQLSDAEVGNARVGHRFVAALEDAELDAANAAILLQLAACAARAATARCPLFGKTKAAVPELAHAERVVARALELHDQRLVCFHALPVRLRVVVNTCDVRPLAREQRRAGRIANGRRAIRSRERDAHFREPVDVRRLRLWIPPEMADPMIEIVHGDEENIGFLRRCYGRTGEYAESKHDGNENAFHGMPGNFTRDDWMPLAVMASRGSELLWQRRAEGCWPLRFFGQR